MVESGSRCSLHAREHEARRKREGATGRNAVPRDPRARRAVLRRDGGRCVVCGSTEDLRAHHVNGDPRDSDLGNLVTLCEPHHREADRKLREARASAGRR